MRVSLLGQMLQPALCLLAGIVGGLLSPLVWERTLSNRMPLPAGVLRTGRIELVDARGMVTAFLTATHAGIPAALVFVDDAGIERLRYGLSAASQSALVSAKGRDGRERLGSWEQRSVQ